MKFSTLTAIALAAVNASAYVTDPPGPVLPSTISTCNLWVLPTSGTCATIEAAAGITAAQFILYNPLAGTTTSCTIVVGFAYCIGVAGTASTTSTSTVSSTSSSSTITSTGTTLTTVTTTGDGISTPGPIQTGMVATCNSFYFVVTNDTCTDIASNHGISLANFYAWNPAVGTSCAYLDLSEYVCVGIIGMTTSTTVSTTGNGVSTPAAIQTGMVATCNAFYLVVANDQCAVIAANHGISLANFYLWNPAVGSTCAYLDIADYVCVGIIGMTTATTTTTSVSTTGNGITTPTPYQTGMATNCNTFYLVVANDQCAVIAANKGISLANFYLWNPAVGSTCAYLDVGDYVCVNVIGGTTSTSTTTTAATTTSGAVVTPTPTQAGMVSGCKLFHYVVSGDQCGTIASNAGITLANFYLWNPAVGSTCASLWALYYVCIGI